MGYETAPPEEDDDVTYHAVEVNPVERGGETSVDYAILRLKKPVRNVVPISAFVAEPGPGQKLTILAHPGGSPLLITQQNCRTKQSNSITEREIVHECVTEVGSSGALVYDDDWRVVGLHSRAVYGTKYAVRIGAIIKESLILKDLFFIESDGDANSTQYPSSDNLPEDWQCRAGADNKLIWEKALILQSPHLNIDDSIHGIVPSKWISGEPWKPGSSFSDCRECPEMVVIPIGENWIGFRPGDANIPSNADNQFKFTVPSYFAIGRTEITVAEWREFVRETSYELGSCKAHEQEGMEGYQLSWNRPGFTQNDNHPVVCVSWLDAQAYVDWLNSKIDGRPYRLPDGHEWEYASRAGSRTVRFWGDDLKDKIACKYANVSDISRLGSFHCQDGYSKTSPAGTFKPNSFGVYDTLGNVWEWTNDCSTFIVGFLKTIGPCPERKVRGGSWYSGNYYVRSALGIHYHDDERTTGIGFRVYKSLTTSASK